jgi:DNA-binding HxlR family transcriptional regulator
VAPPSRQRAALAAALDSVGDRWTMLVVAALLDGPRRFGELHEELEGIAPNVLTDRLRKLERAGLALGRAYSERPPRYLYELTTAGSELADVVALLAGWGARNAPLEEPPTHGACGTRLELRWWCPACQEPVGEDEAGSSQLL